MKTLFLALLFSLFRLSSYAQSTALFKNYLQDAIDTKLSSLALADKYFCTVQLHRTGPDGEWIRQITDAWLSGQRKLLREKKVSVDAVKFTPYDVLTTEQRPAKPFHIMDKTSNIYVALYHEEVVCFFLVKDGRIASTLLLGMAGESSFIDYCATPG